MAKTAIEVGLKLQDQMTSGLQKASRALQGFQSATQKALSGIVSVFRAAVSPVQKLFSSILNLKTLLLSYGAVKLTNFVVGIEDAERAFKNMMQTLGEDSRETLARLRASVKGTVSDLDLMATANRAVLLGAAKSGDELELMGNLARRLGRAMGRDVKDAFEDLALGIGRQSRLILDNLGIIVRVEDANKAYARALGKTEDALSDVEKRQAFMNAVVEGAQQRIATLGPDVESLSDKYGQLRSTLKNMATDLLGAFNPLLRDVFEKLQKWLEDNRGSIHSYFAGLLRAADQAIPPIISAVERLTDKAWALVQPLLKVNEVLGQWSLGSAAGDLETAESKLREAAAYEERRRLNKITTGSYYPGAEVAPIPGGEAERRRGETSEQYLERMVGSGLVKRMQKEARDYRLAVEEMRRAQQLYSQLQGRQDPYTWQGPQQAEGPSPLEQAARMVEAAAARRADESQAAIMREALLKRQQVMAQVYGATQGPGVGAPFNMPAPDGAEWTKSLHEIEPVTHEILRTKTALEGATDALKRMRDVGTDTFGQINDAILAAGDSIADNFAAQMTHAAFETNKFGDAFKAMAKGVLQDLTQMAIRMAVVRAIGFGAKALVGAGESSSDIQSNFFQIPGTPVSGRAAGGVATMPGMYPLAERGVEAVVPLSGGRFIPVQMVGGGGGGGPQVVNYYNVTATDAQSFDRLFMQSAGRNANFLGNIQQQQYQARPQLRKSYS